MGLRVSLRWKIEEPKIHKMILAYFIEVIGSESNSIAASAICQSQYRNVEDRAISREIALCLQHFVTFCPCGPSLVSRPASKGEKWSCDFGCMCDSESLSQSYHTKIMHDGLMIA